MKKTVTLFLFSIMCVSINAQAPLKNEIDSISYLIGQSIAKNVLGQMLIKFTSNTHFWKSCELGNKVLMRKPRENQQYVKKSVSVW